MQKTMERKTGNRATGNGKAASRITADTRFILTEKGNALADALLDRASLDTEPTRTDMKENMNHDERDAGNH